MEHFHRQTLAQLKDLLDKGSVTSRELTQHFLNRIHRLNPELNAFLSVNDGAIAAAVDSDKRRASGKSRGALEGIPVSIKDNFCTQGIRTTAASKILQNFVPPYSATVVERLEQAGAILLGKTNLDEFAMGSSNENSAFGSVKNPWDPTKVPGGSSGGSAAAVAAAMAPVALGTDTGGSIRLPASYCGIVGVKPTYGRVSRYGIVAFASSLDQAGPLAKTVGDSALVCEVISGRDEKDSTSSEKPVPPWFSLLKADVKGLRIGVPREFRNEALDASVTLAVEKALLSLKEAGAQIVDLDLPHSKYAISTYYIVATSEASSNLARYDGVRYGLRAEGRELESVYCRSRGMGFGSEVKRRIMIGTYALSSGYYDAYYIKACKVRRLIQKDFFTAFQKCDLILGPVAATPAFSAGERISDPMKMYLNDVFTTSANLAGLPGMSVPWTFSREGLPIGVQLMAKPFDEQTMFNTAAVIEAASVAETKREPHVF